MNPIIAQHKDQLIELCKYFSIKTMYVFGSASTNVLKPESDIDLLISFHEIPFDQYTDYYFELHQELEQLFGRKVDLITERSLSNPFFIQRVNETKQLLYAA